MEYMKVACIKSNDVFFSKSYSDKNLNTEDRVCVCVCVGGSFASGSSGTIEVSIVKLGTVTVSDMAMRHVFMILTLIFTEGHRS